MVMREFVVHADTDELFERRLDYACRLAAGSEARLTGVYAAPPPFMPPYLAGLPAPTVIDAQIAYTGEQADEAEARFWKVVRAAKADARWRRVEGYRAAVVAAAARYADVAVVGQTEPAGGGAATDYDVPAQVLFDCGRPVIIVPYVGELAPPKTVLLAWDGSREAARAAADALPLLAAAARTVVVGIDEDADRDLVSEAPSDDLAEHLGHHGVAASSLVLSAGGAEVAHVLLSQAAEMEADMIVMGAYGHSRVRELVMGGATHDVLRRTTIPVLMSR